ncbi:Momilactone A synthase [Fulvia fulva]|uniref:Momilactone A synthase n=1 Tax=Passalora fulva TaxID=5499 RepID=A0A9Q8UU21_PASFU|nr:Momilactone A synthase [Fulvia fulva]KAK4627483.1 Momilactone A synthase [Fulvia fulva]UJO22451.1 Momilactone A synthase [Fulvia fulva]WPV29082.1 Momilactone A synthase [Fulvia fulva]
MQYGPVPDFPIKGKIVAITGGGSGIGLALAKQCHERGVKVLIGDLKLVPEAEFITQVPAGEVVNTHCDVTSWRSLHDLITTSVEKVGDVPDVYVASAGVFEPPWSNFWDDNEEESYKMIQINVSHPVKLTRLAMRALAGAKKQGVVALLASSAGIRGNYLASLYVTSKHAIVGFTKSMGQADIEEGVKIVCIMPGMVQSPLWEDRADEVATATQYYERLKTALQPADIADNLIRMIESKGYGGGSCVLKTKTEERIVEEGHAKSLGKYDPSPRPEPDLDRIKKLLEEERGKPWS